MLEAGTSFPHESHPGAASLAKSSIRGKSPISSTILSRVSAGLRLCCWTGERMTLCTLALMRFGLPFTASRQISELLRVQLPRPQNRPAPVLFCFTQLKATVL